MALLSSPVQCWWQSLAAETQQVSARLQQKLSPPPRPAQAQTTCRLLCCCSKHNDNTWTVPGGNVEDTDSSLLGTATREAMEELGSVPPFEVKAQITTK
jgi:ADP-ribose pyrophosphatase YjhB (NUDIX family)